MLAGRGLQWVRAQVIALPPHLALSHPAMPDLALMTELASALGHLRGRPSPLQDLAGRRFTAHHAKRAARRTLRWPHARPAMLPLVIAGRHLVPNDPDWRRARDLLMPEARRDPEHWLALAGPRDPEALAQAEALLGTPIPQDAATEVRIDRFARTLMRAYAFGMIRPDFGRVASYGIAFTTCLGFAEWATRRRRLVPLAQMVSCLRLIDPGHDVAPLLADIIPHQRPDGSFPVTMGHSLQDQDLAAGNWPTLMATLALHLALRKGGHELRPYPLAA